MSVEKIDTEHVTQTSVLKCLEVLTLSLTQMKLEFGTKLDQLNTNSAKIEKAIEDFNGRLEIIEEWTVSKARQPEVRTPLTKIHETNLTKEIKVLKAELFKLNEENESLKKQKKKQFKHDVKPKFRVNDFEILKSDNGDFSQDEILKEMQIGGRNNKVREFCLDSVPSHSFQNKKEFPNGFGMSKDMDSDDGSVRTSKGNGNVFAGKYPALSSKFSQDFQFGFLNNHHFDGKGMPSIGKQLGKKKSSITSNDSKCKEEEHERPLRDSSIASDQKKMSIKNVKNFCDFQLLLRDLKNSLNASIYATFNDNIEENVQLLNSLLERYRNVDDKIEGLYKNIKTQKNQLQKTSDTRQKDPSSEENSPEYQSIMESYSKLMELRNTSNFCLYEQKLIQIQSNPSEFESFLYTIKAELSKREKACWDVESQVKAESHNF